MALLLFLLAALVGSCAANDFTPVDSGFYPWRWRRGSGTFYGGADASGTMGGACGYGNLYSSGYGQATAAASPTLFKDGFGCGGCYQVKCVPSMWNQFNCINGSTATVTVTNLCPAGSANPLCTGKVWHLDMAQPMYSRIAQEISGQVRTHWRRVKCMRTGNINFHLSGNPFYLNVLLTNVAGSGDIDEVWIQGNSNGWIQMQQNWGAIYSISHQLGGQTLSFRLKTHLTKEWLEIDNAIPCNWYLGGTYSAGQFNQYGPGSVNRRVNRRRSMEIEAELEGQELPAWDEDLDGPMPLLDEDSPDNGLWNPEEEWRVGGSFDHPGKVQDAMGKSFVIDVNLDTKAATPVTEEQLAAEKLNTAETAGPKSRRMLM